jgi:hypothetical protein
MTAILSSYRVTSTRPCVRAPIPAALLLVLLAFAPSVALGQQPPAPPSPRDTSAARMQQMQQQMMGMFSQMGPMYEAMMKSMVDGTLKAMGEPENVERLAAFTRRYYEALLKQGFAKEEALAIVAGVGVPALRMGK